MTDSFEFVRLDTSEDGVATVTIDRPKALNALNAQVVAELQQIFHALGDGTARAVILTGAGDKAFVAGADIAAMKSMNEAEALEFSRAGHALMEAIEALPAPVLAAVNGFALGGGCELALACDIIYCSDTAKFGQPEVKLGLMPGFGGAVRLPRKIGAAAAAEWIFTGEIYGAVAAERIGLVREVCPAETLLKRVREVAETIALRAPLAVSASKRLIVDGLATDFARAASMEQERFAALFGTEDMREGTSAFVEKRSPTFQGK